MKRFRLIGPLMLALMLGCGSEEAKPDSVALFMFDASGSCKGLREQFRGEFRQKLMIMEGTRVYVDLIGANRVPRYPVSFEIPKRKGPLAEYGEDFDRERARIANDADAELEALFRQQDEELKEAEKSTPDSATDTNIVLTVALVTLFQRDGIRDLKHKEFLLFTDGIQQSPELDVTSDKLKLKELNEEVTRLQRQGLVPLLDKVNVSVGGLAVGKGKQLSASRIILIRKFWQLYFERSGARFNPASLDGTVAE